MWPVQEARFVHQIWPQQLATNTEVKKILNQTLMISPPNFRGKRGEFWKNLVFCSLTCKSSGNHQDTLLYEPFFLSKICLPIFNPTNPYQIFTALKPKFYFLEFDQEQEVGLAVVGEKRLEQENQNSREGRGYLLSRPSHITVLSKDVALHRRRAVLW